MIDYTNAGLGHTISKEEVSWITLVLAFGFVVYLTELFIYIYLFLYLYHHNSDTFVLRVEEKKSRNRNNAQTLVGQFYLFVTDLSYILLLFLFTAPKVSSHSKDIVAFLKQMEFGISSLVQCLLVPVQRRKIIKWFQSKIMHQHNE